MCQALNKYKDSKYSKWYGRHTDIPSQGFATKIT